MTGATQAVFMNQRSFIGGFLTTLYGASSTQEAGYGIAVDSSGNVYVAGHSNSSGTGTPDFQVAKYNNSGTIQWQRYLGGAFEQIARGIVVDSSGNLYVGGYGVVSGGSYDFQLAKYNNSGTIQWQRSLGASNEQLGYAIALDSSSNVYIVGYARITSSSGPFALQLAKYDTSGTIQWQRNLSASGSDQVGYGIAVDSSSNVYVTGYTTAPGSFAILLAKYNTSGTIQWQRSLGDPGLSSAIGYGIAVDSSSNVYVVGYSDRLGTNDLILAKYNTSGTIQWQRYLGGTGSQVGYGIAVDSSSNVYVTGYTYNPYFPGYNDFLLAKYNTSGTIQWQRSLGQDAALDDKGYGITVDNLSHFYVVGAAAGSSIDSDFLFGKLPVDGSGRGTITVGGMSFVYAASALTDAASTLTDSTTSLTDAASTLTDAATTLTDAASSLNTATTSF